MNPEPAMINPTEGICRVLPCGAAEFPVSAVTRPGARHNGWQAPLESLQIVTWVLFLVLAAGFYALLLPYFGLAARIALGVVRANPCNLSPPRPAEGKGALERERRRAPFPQRRPLRRRARRSRRGGGPHAQCSFARALATAAGLRAGPARHRGGDGPRNGTRPGRPGDAPASRASRPVRPPSSPSTLGRVCERDRRSNDTARLAARVAQERSSRRRVADDLAYCYLCRRYVSVNSRHCRQCQKCVSDYDHHCLWLNNCVGARNYVPFVTLLVSTVLLLLLEFAVGLVPVVEMGAYRDTYNRRRTYARPRVQTDEGMGRPDERVRRGGGDGMEGSTMEGRIDEGMVMVPLDDLERSPRAQWWTDSVPRTVPCRSGTSSACRSCSSW